MAQRKASRLNADNALDADSTAADNGQCVVSMKANCTKTTALSRLPTTTKTYQTEDNLLTQTSLNL